MLCKPVEAFQLNHKSFCNHFWYHVDDPQETWLSGNYSTTMYNKRVDRDTTYLTDCCPQVGHNVEGEQLDKARC